MGRKLFSGFPARRLLFEGPNMEANAYRKLISDNGLSQRAAAKIIRVDERTSRKYAASGVPEKSAAWVREKIAEYARQANNPDKKEERG